MKIRNTYLKRILSVLVILAAVLVLFHFTEKLVERKASVEKNGELLTESEDPDVLFLGTSHVLNDVYPMQLWKDYGITSYNLGGHNTELATSYWVLRNTLDHVQPRLVVVDCFLLASDVKVSDNSELLHISMDFLPLNADKVRAAADLTDTRSWSQWRDAGGIKSKFTEVIFPFEMYHNRWNELGMEDFSPYYGDDRGADIRVGVTPYTEYEPYVRSDEVISTDSVGCEYLQKIIDLCNERGIEVLLMYLPTKAKYYSQVNTVYGIAEEAGVEYLNLNMDGLWDPDNDYYDFGDHLNPIGASKVTERIGSYLSADMGMTDHRGEAGYEFWDEDYDSYRNSYRYLFDEQDDFRAYLTLVYGGGYDAELIFKDDTVCSEPFFDRFLEEAAEAGLNINVQYGAEAQIDWTASGSGDDESDDSDGFNAYIVITDHETGETVREDRLSLSFGSEDGSIGIS